MFVLGLIVGDGGELLGLVPSNTADNIIHLLLDLLGLATRPQASQALGRA